MSQSHLIDHIWRRLQRGSYWSSRQSAQHDGLQTTRTLTFRAPHAVYIEEVAQGTGTSTHEVEMTRVQLSAWFASLPSWQQEAMARWCSGAR